MADRNVIRKNNTQLVQKTLFQAGKLLASDLVKQTGISMVTINSLLKELTADRQVFEGRLVKGDVGRPAIEYCFNYKYAYALLLAVRQKGRQLFVHCLTIDLAGTVHQEELVPFPEISAQQFQAILKDCLDKTFFPVAKIGILLPGKINDGIIRSGWDDSFDGWDLKQLTAAVTNLPCRFQNDAHLLTIGHCLQQKISLAEPLVGIYHPRHSMPGITVIANQQLLEGNHSLAGEAKYLPGFINAGVAKDDHDLAARITDLLTFYNAAIAPSRFIIATAGVSEDEILTAIASNPYLPQQPNKPHIEFVADFEKSLILGLHWLLYQDTPYSLSEA